MNLPCQRRCQRRQDNGREDIVVDANLEGVANLPCQRQYQRQQENRREGIITKRHSKIIIEK